MKYFFSQIYEGSLKYMEGLKYTSKIYIYIGTSLIKPV